MESREIVIGEIRSSSKWNEDKARMVCYSPRIGATLNPKYAR